MKEQYRQEMQRIHVPESLLEKTKLAMKEEEQRIKSMESERKAIPFSKISVAAAAAVILLLGAWLKELIDKIGELFE